VGKANVAAQNNLREGKAPAEVSKQANVTCYSCAKWSHFSTDCKEPKICFICQTSSHVGRNCPKWLKPLEPALYLVSAA
jgi:hypothetical protein